LSYLRDSPAKDVIAAVLVSPVDMFGYFQRKEGAEALFSEATTLSQEGKSDQILSSPLDGDTYLSARTLLNVFSPESGANVFCYTDRKHDWSVVNSVSVPVLLIGGTDDSPMETVRSTGESFKILSEQLRGCPRVHSKIYP
jgi:hypothetical protein